MNKPDMKTDFILYGSVFNIFPGLKHFFKINIILAECIRHTRKGYQKC